jgi:hypothetical protein
MVVLLVSVFLQGEENRAFRTGPADGGKRMMPSLISSSNSLRVEEPKISAGLIPDSSSKQTTGLLVSGRPDRWLFFYIVSYAHVEPTSS